MGPSPVLGANGGRIASGPGDNCAMEWHSRGVRRVRRGARELTNYLLAARNRRSSVLELQSILRVSFPAFGLFTCVFEARSAERRLLSRLEGTTSLKLPSQGSDANCRVSRV